MGWKPPVSAAAQMYRVIRCSFQKSALLKNPHRDQFRRNHLGDDGVRAVVPPTDEELAIEPAVIFPVMPRPRAVDEVSQQVDLSNRLL